MANEAILVYETEPAIPFTVADGAGIEKGSICKFADPMTAAITAGANDAFGGIAKTEKIANDRRTKLSLYRGGIFKMVTIAAITAGEAVTTSATANKIQKATNASVNSAILGVALESSGGDTETILVEVRPGYNNNGY